MIGKDQPLRPSDILGHADLISLAEKGGSALVTHEAGVHCGRPLFYPVPAADLPPALRLRAGPDSCRYFGALFAFDLDDLPRGSRYVAARFEVNLVDHRTVANQIHADGDALGLLYGFDAATPASTVAVRTISAARVRPGWMGRMARRPGDARARPSGLRSNNFGWIFQDHRGELLIPRTFALHALIEAPAEVASLTGRLSVEVEVARAGRRRQASMRESLTFDEPLPGPVPDNAGAAVRLCMAADIESYSRLSNSAAEQAQHRLVDAMARARRHAALDERGVHLQPQGDEEFAIFPVGIDESRVIPRLIEGLASALFQLNQAADGAPGIRLRVAMHRGLMGPAASGWVGVAPTAVHRILNSGPLRAALREHPATDFVLGVPDVLFHDVIAQSDSTLPADDFEEITVAEPDKGFTQQVWLYVPVGRPHE